MSGLDVSHLSPDDAVAALRSYPRRFRDLVQSVEPQELPADVPDHIDQVARSVALLGESLRQLLVQDHPVLMPAVADDRAREWSYAGSSSPDDLLAFLDMECNALADTIRQVSADAWTRSGSIAGSGQDLTALDLVREAVRTGSEHLRAAERSF